MNKKYTCLIEVTMIYYCMAVMAVTRVKHRSANSGYCRPHFFILALMLFAIWDIYQHIESCFFETSVDATLLPFPFDARFATRHRPQLKPDAQNPRGTRYQSRGNARKQGQNPKSFFVLASCVSSSVLSKAPHVIGTGMTRDHLEQFLPMLSSGSCLIQRPDVNFPRCVLILSSLYSIICVYR